MARKHCAGETVQTAVQKLAIDPITGEFPSRDRIWWPTSIGSYRKLVPVHLRAISVLVTISGLHFQLHNNFPSQK